MMAAIPVLQPPQRRNGFFWLILAPNVLLSGVYVLFALLNGGGAFEWTALIFAVYPIAAAIILQRQARNRSAWALAAVGLLFTVSNATKQYAIYALVTRPGSLPLGDIFAWVSSWTWLAADMFAVPAILLFPDGNPPSRRWWALVALAFATDIPLIGWIMVVFWPLRGAGLVMADVQSAVGPSAWQAFSRLFAIWSPVFTACLALAVAGLAVRFARSRGIERQQLKWILFALTFVPIGVGAGSLVPSSSPLMDTVASVLNILSILAFPVGMAFAVTRYRLYDIDVIIRRTLLYGALTVALALLYYGDVILLQTILTKIGGQRSPVSIVLSTLLIAALFNPLRSRFQKIIDRRFFRSKYDSAQILERFTASLRAEVDLEAINRNLLEMVDESLQPDSAGLWLVADSQKRVHG